MFQTKLRSLRWRPVADSRTQLDGLLGALPLYEWMHIAVTPLEPHPNDPANGDHDEQH
jgi:muconolactone D-isomerase